MLAESAAWSGPDMLKTGISTPKASTAAKGQREAIEIQSGKDNFVTPEGNAPVRDWLAKGYLVFMDAREGGKAPAGDIRFVVDTREGVHQLVIVQCKKCNSKDTVRLEQIRNVYDRLQDCVGRWNASNPASVLELVCVWITTGRLSKRAARVLSRRPGLILVGQEAVSQMCPVLDLLPQMYTGTSHSYTALNEFSQPAHMHRPSGSAKTALTAMLRMEHGMHTRHICPEQMPDCNLARLTPSRRRLYTIRGLTPVIKLGGCHSTLG